MQQIDPQVQELLALPPVRQIGVVVRDMQKALDTYTNLFRLAPFHVFEPEYTNQTYRGKPGNFKMRIAIGKLSPAVDFELIQPLRGETIYDEFLQTRGEGLHHLGFEVKNIEQRIAAMKQMGIAVLQSGRRPGAIWAYMDTEALAGIIIEWIER
jgi:4-hydroxyphenylpyruvate dioxygenase-like putative hemolysin